MALFLRRLLEWMCRKLKAGSHTTPDQLAVAPDELWEDSGCSISTVQPPNTKGGNNSHKPRSKSKSNKSNWRQRSASRSPSPHRCRLMKDYPNGQHLWVVYHQT